MRFDMTICGYAINCQRIDNVWEEPTRCSHLINLCLSTKTVAICATYKYDHAGSMGLVPKDGFYCCNAQDFMEAFELVYTELMNERV